MDIANQSQHVHKCISYVDCPDVINYYSQYEHVLSLRALLSVIKINFTVTD